MVITDPRSKKKKKKANRDPCSTTTTTRARKTKSKKIQKFVFENLVTYMYIQQCISQEGGFHVKCRYSATVASSRGRLEQCGAPLDTNMTGSVASDNAQLSLAWQFIVGPREEG